MQISFSESNFLSERESFETQVNSNSNSKKKQYTIQYNT